MIPDPVIPPAAGQVRRDPARGLGRALYAAVFIVLLLEPFALRWPIPQPLPIATGLSMLVEDPEVAAVEVLKSLGHALLFLPLGPLVAWGRGLRARRLLGLRALLLVSALSVASEAAQILVARGVSLLDAFMDLLGYVLGVGLLEIHRRSGRIRSLAVLATSRPALGGAILLCAAILYLAWVPSESPPLGPGGLGTWNRTFPLLVGNEPTFSRPWSGDVASVAIWPRALEPEAVRLALDGGLAEGPRSRGPGRAPSAPDALPQPVAAYTFGAESLLLDEAGGVREVRAATGSPLRARREEVVPSPEGWVTIRRGAVLRADGDAWARALDAVVQSGELTVAARFRPADLQQDGPARIVSSSVNARERNFTLGQAGRGLELRVRTRLTGYNGARPALLVEGCLEPGRWVEAVATYAGGVLRLWIDGREVGRRTTHWAGWLAGHFFGQGAGILVDGGLLFLAWCAAFVLLWAFLRRGRSREGRSPGRRSPGSSWSLGASAIGAALLLAVVRTLAL